MIIERRRQESPSGKVEGKWLLPLSIEMDGRPTKEGRCQRTPSVKSGQMYSILMILMIVPILLFLVLYLTASQDLKFGTTEKIIADQQHQVAQEIENDFVRAMKITGKRALLAAVNKVAVDGEYLDNSTLRIHELITNSSLYGYSNTLMANNTLSEWRSRVLSQEHSFIIDASFSDPVVQNYDGINIKISMVVTVNVSDRLNASRIDRVVLKEVLVSVDGIEDPTFPLNTNDYVKRVVTAYPFPYYTMKIQGSQNVGNCSGNSTYNPNDPSPSGKILVIQNTTGISNPALQGFSGVVVKDTENLGLKGVACFVSGATEVLSIPQGQKTWIDNMTASAWLLPINIGIQENHYYKGAGPNFLQRLEGDLSPSPDGKGLESFVADEIGIPDKPVQTRVDYMFFSNQSYPGCKRARWVDDWIRLQPSEMSRYNLTELSYSVC